ncbi:MAG: FMN-binding protein [Chloroflexi bacterium]|nr:FMN-binding protein [Chloroflexota bacterium]
MAKSMPRRVVALSVSAVAAVFIAGHLVTQGADTQLATTEPPPAIVAAAAPPATLAPTPVLPSGAVVPPYLGGSGQYGGGGSPGRSNANSNVNINSNSHDDDDEESHDDRKSRSRLIPPIGRIAARPSSQSVSRPGAPSGTQPSGQAVAQSANPSPGQSSAQQAPQPPTPPVAAAPASTASQTTGTYRDGTYSGTGTSRRGGFTVAVTVQGGKIANVAVTRATTQYPMSRIAALPGQVVARQSAQVDNVTGATYSAQAFRQAVEQALVQAGAQAAETPAGTSTALAG